MLWSARNFNGNIIVLLRRALSLILLCVLGLLVEAGPSYALDVVRVDPDAASTNLLPTIERHRSSGDEIRISTAPGADGIVRRIVVKAKAEGTRPDWMVMALRNDGTREITRWIVAPHVHLVGSGLIWPDLGATRITNLTSSQGENPDRQPSADADIFEITLDPGVSVTLVGELATQALPELMLWNPDDYKEKANGLTFYRGIITGIIGLIALFLTIIMLVRGTILFPAAAALAWSVAAYVAVDFGFFSRILSVTPEGERLYRAGAEAVLAATLLVFLFAYLNLNRWHVRYSQIITVWGLFIAGLIAVAIIDPPVASGVARISIATIAAVGLLLVLYLATHGYDRAVLLIPTWFVLFAWVTAAAFTLMGRVTSDLAAHSLMGGLVLIILLIGFTVMQHAFTGGVMTGGEIPDTSRKALALAGAGDIIFDWDVPGDFIRVGVDAENILGVARGRLSSPPGEWIGNLYPADRDRFAASADTVFHQKQGRISLDFRLKAEDGHFRWFKLRARPIIGADGMILRLMGTLADITDTKVAEERLLHDAVHDSLTGLPNRRLMLDRIDLLLSLARGGETIRPTVVSIDIDKFRDVNDQLGLSGGDALLLAITRRLLKLLRPQDGLARIGADKFAILLLSESEPGPITNFVDTIRKSLATPIAVGNREAQLTVSIGIALPDQRNETKADILLRNAEIAMIHAKKLGGDRIDVFRPAMRAQRSDKLALEIDLRDAVRLNQIDMSYRPIVRLQDRSISGFEAIAHWSHPKHGRLSQAEFLDVSEDPELIGALGVHLIELATKELEGWQKMLDVDPPFFAVLPLNDLLLQRNELVQDVKFVLSRSSIIRGTLRIEVSERYLADHSEQAVHALNGLVDVGAGLVLGDFGHGYSSLGYLERFPFESIKLARSITRSDSSGVKPAILRSIVTLAHDLNIEAIADGIDTESDAVQFTQIGFGMGQGLAFGAALSANETRRLIRG